MVDVTNRPDVAMRLRPFKFLFGHLCSLSNAALRHAACDVHTLRNGGVHPR
jgi:hypothetical protein